MSVFSLFVVLFCNWWAGWTHTFQYVAYAIVYYRKSAIHLCVCMCTACNLLILSIVNHIATNKQQQHKKSILHIEQYNSKLCSQYNNIVLIYLLNAIIYPGGARTSLLLFCCVYFVSQINRPTKNFHYRNKRNEYNKTIQNKKKWENTERKPATALVKFYCDEMHIICG